MMATGIINSFDYNQRSRPTQLPPSEDLTTHPSFCLKNVGLDPLNRVFFKLFIRDVLSLNDCVFEEVNSAVFVFHGHVVVRVEIVGIIVRVDLKDSRHSYVVDDGSGTIVCNVWKRGKQGSAQVASGSGLPQSLVQKQEAVISSWTPIKEGFQLSDSVCVRGRVISFAGRKEIDVLDMFKYENPNFELHRVLELPHLYSKCYRKPVPLPNQTSTFSSASELAMNPDLLKFNILKHLERNEAEIDVFTVNDLLTGMSIESLRNSSLGNSSILMLTESALELISESHGFICKRLDMACSSCSYEMVKQGCGLCHEILNILQMFQYKQSEGTSFHIKQIRAALKNSRHYSGAPATAVQRALQILENTSDVIQVDSNRYMPLV